MNTKSLSTHFVFNFALFLVFAIIALPFPVRAATYLVTNTDDSGAGSLREAVNTANSTPADDLINFNIAGCPNEICTIQLVSGQLSINSASSAGSLSIINAAGASKLRIFGGSTHPNYFRVLGLDGGAVATIDGVTFSNGVANLVDGSGINNYGNLTLKNSVVSYNRSFPGNDANSAGIHNAPSAVLTLIKTTVSNNENQTTTGGGGICNNGGSLTLTDSTVANNSSRLGGGIYTSSGMTMTNSSVTNNYALSGGGVFNVGTAFINNSNIRDNDTSFESVGGGINNVGTITVDGSTISGNESSGGGGIYSTGTATVNNSTISGNIAGTGAGIENYGALSVSSSLIKGNHDSENAYSFFAGGGINNQQGATAIVANTTIVGNYMIYNAGGVSNAGAMTLVNSTVARNFGNGADDGAGIVVMFGGTLHIRNTIVAENFGYENAPSDVCKFEANIVSNGNNFIQSQACESVAWQSSDILNQAPRFAPLGNYGGATETLPLTNNSPAVDAGNNCVITLNGCGDNNPAIATDQRGAARVGNVDIGAFELNNTANGGNYRAATPDGKVNVPFNYLLTADSGNFTYSVTAGMLPPGLALSNSAGFGSKTAAASFESASRSPQAGAYSITGTPTMGGAFNYTITATDGTNSVSTNYATTVQAAPTAATVNVGGRVLTTGGQGIANARVTLTDGSGNVRTASTNTFGYYTFKQVAAGSTYILTAIHKRYVFAQPTQILSIAEDRSDIDFVEIP